MIYYNDEFLINWFTNPPTKVNTLGMQSNLKPDYDKRDYALQEYIDYVERKMIESLGIPKEILNEPRNS